MCLFDIDEHGLGVCAFFILTNLRNEDKNREYFFSHFLFDYLPLNRVERRFWLRGRGYDIRRNVSARKKIRNWTAIRLLKFEIFMHLIFCSNASKSNKLFFHVEDCTVSIEIPICMLVYAIVTHFLCFCDWMTYSYDKKVSTWFYKLPTRIQHIYYQVKIQL